MNLPHTNNLNKPALLKGVKVVILPQIRYASALPGILLNLYGSKEVAGDVTWAEFAEDIGNIEPDVPIGQPILNAEIYILDENLQPVLPCEVGELWVGGIVLARGYHKKPEETKARFIPNPFSGNGILFKTASGVCCSFYS